MDCITIFCYVSMSIVSKLSCLALTVFPLLHEIITSDHFSLYDFVSCFFWVVVVFFLSGCIICIVCFVDSDVYRIV